MATLENERPLKGWKAIADYLDCSVKTAQRWERKGLPVVRHEALGVIAYPWELDAWTRTLRTADPPQQDLSVPERSMASDSGLTNGAGSPIGCDRPVGAVKEELSEVRKDLDRFRPRNWPFIGAGAALFAVLIMAILAPSYGLAVLFFTVGAIFVVLTYERCQDTPMARAVVALYMIVGMSYTASALTMPEFQAAVINAPTLPVAPAFLFVIGLKFIPLYLLVLVYWVVLGCRGDAGFSARPALERAYTFLGILFLLVELAALGAASGDDRVSKVDLPARWTLLAGSLVVLAANLAVWLVGHRCFRGAFIAGYGRLFALCASAYLMIALASFFIDREHNRINRDDLGIRWPQAYVVANPDAIRDSQLRSSLRGEIGPDLLSLLNDPNFYNALRSEEFYKQHLDESFRLRGRAVTFGYRPISSFPHKPLPFVVIRFPQELADALRFQPVGDEK